MNYMNHTNFLIRVVSQPERSLFKIENDDIMSAEFLAKFYQYKNKPHTFCKIKVWGNLAYDTLKYYNINDFLMVEGSLRVNKSTSEDLKLPTSLEIYVSRIYPFALRKKNK